ncbi:hypothetical protein V5O48_019425, partial [Marasmius crinis-equi]
MDLDDPKRNEELKNANEKRWREGREVTDRWMACTQAFGQGVDYGRVRAVIHVDPRDIVNYAQETGRGGRDGKPALCIAFWWKLPKGFYDPNSVDHLGRNEMRALLETGRCLRLCFAALDREVHSCVALNGELCGNCEVMAKLPYGYVTPDVARYDKPLVTVARQSEEGRLVTETVAMTVETNANDIREESA